MCNFVTASGNPRASASDLKIVYIPVEFLGKSRALCALKTMAYGDQDQPSNCSHPAGGRAERVLDRGARTEFFRSQAGWLRYADSCLLRHARFRARLLLHPLSSIAINSNSNFYKFSESQPFLGQARYL